MKINILVFLACATAIFSACTKDRHKAYINGQVVDATTGVGLAGATVYMQKKSTSCFGCGASTFATITSDSKGYFVYSYTPEKSTSYYVVATANNYFSNAPSGGVALGSSTGSQEISVKLDPYAWIKLHFKKISPYDGMDQIDYGAGSGYSTFGGSFYGTNVDTILSPILTYGNQNQILYIRITKNSIVNTYTYSPYCPELYTTTYSINY